jgi:hypothetical protein
MIGLKPGEHIQPKLLGSLHKIIDIARVDDARVIIHLLAPQFGTMRKEDHGIFIFTSQGKHQRIDLVLMHAFPLCDSIAGCTQRNPAQGQGGIIGMTKSAIRADRLNAGI